MMLSQRKLMWLLPLLPDLLSKVERCVAEVGRQLRDYRGPKPTDTGFEHGHESSSIDKVARDLLHAELSREFGDKDSVVWTEDHPVEMKVLKEGVAPAKSVRGRVGRRRKDKLAIKLVIISDELEGTTNTKRRYFARFGKGLPPAAGVLMAVSVSMDLSDVVVSAFYNFQTGEVYSAIRQLSEDGQPKFATLVDRFWVEQSWFTDKQGDSAYRIIVPGYSNNARKKLADLEELLYAAKLKTYGGCRASAVDIVSILLNAYDAYVDCRAYWSHKDHGEEKNAMLQGYDIVGMIPIALGCGLKVSDPLGNPWWSYDFRGPLPLVIARPAIHERILKAINPLVTKWSGRK